MKKKKEKKIVFVTEGENIAENLLQSLIKMFQYMRETIEYGITCITRYLCRDI